MSTTEPSKGELFCQLNRSRTQRTGWSPIQRKRNGTPETVPRLYLGFHPVVLFSVWYGERLTETYTKHWDREEWLYNPSISVDGVSQRTRYFSPKSIVVYGPVTRTPDSWSQDLSVPRRAVLPVNLHLPWPLTESSTGTVREDLEPSRVSSWGPLIPFSPIRTSWDRTKTEESEWLHSIYEPLLLLPPSFPPPLPSLSVRPEYLLQPEGSRDFSKIIHHRDDYLHSCTYTGTSVSLQCVLYVVSSGPLTRRRDCVLSLSHCRISYTLELQTHSFQIPSAKSRVSTLLGISGGWGSSSPTFVKVHLTLGLKRKGVYNNVSPL